MVVSACFIDFDDSANFLHGIFLPISIKEKKQHA
jgi:hypothetical protein